MENTVLTVEELRKQDPEKYFRDNLEVEEFEGLETLVRDSNGVISWDELNKEGVVKLDGMKVEGIYWNGDLNLRLTEIKSLWKLKKVGGTLDCLWVKSLEDLGVLEEIKEGVVLEGTSIKTLGRLEKIGTSLDCSGVISLTGLGNLQEVGTLWLVGTSVKTLGKLKKVRDSLDCENLKTLEDLGKLEEVGGLDLKGTSIKSLGKLKKVREFLDCKNLKILEDLGDLEEVGSYLDLGCTSITTLGKLKKVGRNLDLDGTKIKSLGKLEEVGGNIYIKGISFETKKKIFRKIREGKLKVEGKIIPYGDMNRMDEYGNLNYKKFREKYGENINEIEDKEIKVIASELLIIDYQLIEENLKEKGKKIQKENEGKKLTEEKKKEIRKKVIKLGKELREIREKIESFGVVLEDL